MNTTLHNNSSRNNNNNKKSKQINTAKHKQKQNTETRGKTDNKNSIKISN